MIKVGIMIKRPESIFTNGCYQQSFFLYKMLNCIPNITCYFITVEVGYTTYNDVDVLQFNDDSAADLHLILMVSLIISRDINPRAIETVKKHNIKLIEVVCGNLFILLQEEYVFNHHHIMKNLVNPDVDEVWVLEMYAYATNFLEFAYKKPVKLLPYVWDTDIIKNYIQTNNVKLNKSSNTEKMNICIYEPNMSIHKNAFIPLLIAERYYEKYGEKLNKVFLFCKETMEKNGYIENLRIFKEGKLESHGRVILPASLSLIQDANPYKTVVLSYNILNNLNFLHLELMYLGVNVVHNCKPFNNGFYFDNDGLHEAVELLDKARVSDANIELNVESIYKFNVNNKSIQSGWSERINTCLSLI